MKDCQCELNDYLLARLKVPHIMGGRRDLDVVIVDGEWYRTALTLIERMRSSSGGNAVDRARD